MISSLRELLNVNLGFNPKNVMTMRLSVPEARYSIARTASFFHQLQERVQTLPGVQAVAIVNQLPMSRRARQMLRLTSRADHLEIPTSMWQTLKSSAPIISTQWGYL